MGAGRELCTGLGTSEEGWEKSREVVVHGVDSSAAILHKLSGRKS